jgi:excisionase family DNA binding protein
VRQATVQEAKLLTTGDVALRLGVHISTVQLWERSGRIRAQRTAGGIRLFMREDVERLARERKGEL